MIFRRGGSKPPVDEPQDEEITRRVPRYVEPKPAGEAAPPPRPPASPAPSPQQRPAAPPPESDEPATRLVSRMSRRPEPAVEPRPAPANLATAAAPSANPADDPVVGWLVVIDGPGKGSSMALGYGMNQIGRQPDQKVCLPFGDELISRTGHAALTYDPMSRKFFLTHGGGRNLTYVAGAPVLSPTELAGGEEILMGRTRLRFVPFCGPSFDWQD